MDSNVSTWIGGVGKDVCHMERPLTAEPNDNEVTCSNVKKCCEYFKSLGPPYSYENDLELVKASFLYP